MCLRSSTPTAKIGEDEAALTEAKRMGDRCTIEPLSKRNLAEAVSITCGRCVYWEVTILGNRFHSTGASAFLLSPNLVDSHWSAIGNQKSAARTD